MPILIASLATYLVIWLVVVLVSWAFCYFLSDKMDVLYEPGPSLLRGLKLGSLWLLAFTAAILVISGIGAGLSFLWTWAGHAG